jgi:CHAT domain-containing protein
MVLFCFLTAMLCGCAKNNIKQAETIVNRDYLCSTCFYNRDYKYFFEQSTLLLQDNNKKLTDLQKAKIHSMSALMHYELHEIKQAENEAEQSESYLRQVDYSFMGARYTYDSAWGVVGEAIKENHKDSYSYDNDPTMLAIQLAFDAIVISAGVIVSLFDDNYNYNQEFDDFLDTLGNIGLVYALLGNDDKANLFIKKLQSLFEKKEIATQDNFFDDSYDDAKDQNSNDEDIVPVVQDYGFGFTRCNMAMARIYTVLHQYDNVIKVLTDQSDPVNHKAWSNILIDSLNLGLSGHREAYNLGRQPSTFLPRQFLLAHSYLKTGNYTKAKLIYENILETKDIDQFGKINYNSLHDIALIYEKEGNSKEAIACLEKAILIIEAQRSTVTTDSGKIGYVGDKQEVYYTLVRLLINNNQVKRAFEFAERGKSRALVDILASKVNFGKQNTDGICNTQKILRELSKEEKLLQDISSQQDKVALRGNIDILHKTIREEFHPQLVSLIVGENITVKDIQKKLSNDETLIEYYGNNECFTAFIITKEKIVSKTISPNGLDKTVKDFRQQVLNYNSNEYHKLSQKLYKILIKPLKEDITTHNLIFVPHGSLHYLPFNALNDGGKFLIEEYAIRILPSASTIKYITPPRKTDATNFLILCNPYLGNTDLDLPATEVEGKMIGSMNKHALFLTKENATETALKKFAHNALYIHIASHAKYDNNNPLRSKILLAKDNSNDGELTVDEIYNLSLNAKLVTLSACETGLGEVCNGDDVIGFSRSLLYAGAQSILSSLWMVDDKSTALLMVFFYKGLRQHSKSEALRLAQIEIIKHYNPHPFFWGAFQLTGNN